MKKVISTPLEVVNDVPTASIIMQCGGCQAMFITDEYSVIPDDSGGDNYFDTCPVCGQLNQSGVDDFDEV